MRKHFASLDAFLIRWRNADRKQAVVDELEEQGIPLDALGADVGIYLDPFDLICHVAFDQPPLTRQQRASSARRKDVFTKYGQQARYMLEALLRKYEDDGVIDLGDPRILQIDPFDKMGTPLQLIRQFGTRDDFERAVHELQSALYEGAAENRCPSETPSNPSRTSCGRTPVSMATPSAFRSFAGCSF